MGVDAPNIRQAPWWLTWVLAGGLGLLFIGERILAGGGFIRFTVSILGLLAVLGCIAWRSVSWRFATGDGKRVEMMLLLAYTGCLVAVVGFVVSSTDGMRWVGIEFLERTAEQRYESAVQVLSSILLVVSLFPALGAQWALSAHRHAGSSAATVESQRVRETANAFLTVALAGAALMLAGYVASEWDETVDFSYFKTSSPGTGAIELTRGMGEELRVILFFADVNEVKDEIRGYFRALRSATGNVTIEEYDRMVAPELAEQYTVSTDGAIVLVRGERSERINITDRIRSARARLRRLDQEIQERLWSLAREQRTAYLTVGHGEYNEPVVAGDGEADPLRSVNILKEGLGVLNYRVEELGLPQGLGTAIPDDAAMVLILGPSRAFLDEELETLDRYLAAGGAVLLALDPDTEFELGPLEQRLGVRYEGVSLANDRQHVRRRGNTSDRQLIVTDQFSAHESVATLGRTRVGSGILLVGSGYLDRVEGGTARQRFVIRSLPTTYADLNGDFEFEESTEVRRSYNLVAAIEADVDAPPSGADAATPNGGVQSGDDADAEPIAQTVSLQNPDGTHQMRAMVYADAGMFADAVISSVGLNAALLADGIRWLGGESAFAGEITNEEDIPIVHTRAEDVALFYSTILGAPLIVLAAGVVTVMRRRAGKAST